MLTGFLVLLLTRHSTELECECAKCGIDKLPDGCTTIRGHVALGFEADMPPYDLVAFKLKNVTKVVGCVTITNTVYTSLEMLTNLRSIQFANRVEAISCNKNRIALAVVNNNFLRNLILPNLQKVMITSDTLNSVYISKNPSLCLTENELEQFLTMDAAFLPHFVVCNPSKVYCQLDTYDTFNETNISPGCQVLTDALVLNRTKPSSEFQKRLDNVEQIIGPIYILHTSLSSISFPKLWRIYNNIPQLPVIVAQDNRNLSEFTMPLIQSIPFIGEFSHSFFASSCPQLVLDPNTCSRLGAIGLVTIDDKDCGSEKMETTEKPMAVRPTINNSLLLENSSLQQRSTDNTQKQFSLGKIDSLNLLLSIFVSILLY